HGLLCARHPGANAADQRRQSASNPRRRGERHRSRSVLGRLSHAAQRQLRSRWGGTRVGIADLRQRTRAALKTPDVYYLIAGAVGIVAALIGAVGAPRVELADRPAAVVNGVPIPQEALTRAMLALENDSRNAITPDRE